MSGAVVLRGVVHSPIVASIVDCKSVRYLLIFLQSPLITGEVVYQTVDIVSDIIVSNRISQLSPKSKGPLKCFSNPE